MQGRQRLLLRAAGEGRRGRGSPRLQRRPGGLPLLPLPVVVGGRAAGCLAQRPLRTAHVQPATQLQQPNRGVMSEGGMGKS